VSNQVDFKSEIAVSSQKLYDWHMAPGAFDRIQPPWEKARIIKKAATIANDLEEHIEVKIGPFTKLWLARYHDVIEGQQFCDRQIKGPLAFWDHHHICNSLEKNKSLLHDKISYKLPLGFLGQKFAGKFTAKSLQRMFTYRHEITRLDLQRFDVSTIESKKILVTGGTGLVGSSLVPFLKNLGHQVSILTRNPRAENHLKWDPIKQTIDREALAQFDTIIHLAGENVGGLWTKKYKQSLISSRVQTTDWFVSELQKHATNLKTFIAASGSNYYPTTTGQTYDESGPAGTGFLADLVQAWEKATHPIKKTNIRLVTLRISMVLSSRGGALEKMLLPCKLGLNKNWGSGKHHFSWIAIDDLVDIIATAVQDENYRDVINVSAPQSISCKGFFDVLAKCLKRKQFLGLPEFFIKAFPGGMGREILLADNRIEPAALKRLAYSHRYSDLERALRHLLGCH
jgi:uncharacterized protein